MMQPADEILEAYAADGYVLATEVMGAADIEPFQRVIARGIDAWAKKLKAEGKIATLFENEPWDRRLAAIFEGQELGLRQWDEVAVTPELWHIISHPKLVDVLESILGPEVAFIGDYHLRPKMPESALTAFPWHQDSQYYGEPTKHMHVVTVTAPLVDLTVENGCLWMIAGSQTWGYLAGARGTDSNIRTFDDVEKRGTPLPIPMNIGDILAFTNLTFHASKLNNTNRVRWTVDIRYFVPREARAAAGASAEELAAYDYLLAKLTPQGRRPMLLRSAKHASTASYEQWISKA
jgi:phytanoyl-CoA hydroxylase